MKSALNNSSPLPIHRIIPFLLFALACREHTKNSPVEGGKTFQKPALIKKPPSSFNDTLVVGSNSAVFYTPDSLQMEKIQSVNEKNVMANIRHNCFFQMQYARSSLKDNWPRIRIIEVSRARFLLFVKTDGTKIYIDLNDKNDICGIFLFDGKKDPVLVDMPNVDTILGSYFRPG